MASRGEKFENQILGVTGLTNFPLKNLPAQRTATTVSGKPMESLRKGKPKESLRKPYDSLITETVHPLTPRRD